nr:hypothetical protein [Opitutaceae bacterium]
MIQRASLHRACVALLLGLHLWLAWTASRGFGPTGDENAHLAGGAAYWLRDDFRIHAENGVLAQRWLGLPFLAAAPHLPPPDDPVWHDNHYVPLAEH